MSKQKLSDDDIKEIAGETALAALGIVLLGLAGLIVAAILFYKALGLALPS